MRPRQWKDWFKSWRSRQDRMRYRASRVEREELARLAALPRYTRTATRLLGSTITLPDSASFVWTYRDIFQRELYAFRTRSERPYIIDGGANIGLSVLYFKRLYPLAEIVAFEPDPYIFGLLQGNLRSHGHDDVRLEQCALWSSATSLLFHSDGADGGRVAREDAAGTAVQAVRLREYLDRHVDLLKLDIEGAEPRCCAIAGMGWIRSNACIWNTIRRWDSPKRCTLFWKSWRRRGSGSRYCPAPWRPGP